VHSQIDRLAPPKLTPQNQGTKFDRFQNPSVLLIVTTSPTAT
jgi:hypothetical protein